ncbi:ATP-dependent Lon protease pim1, partial [Coemansia helicoidea]
MSQLYSSLFWNARHGAARQQGRRGLWQFVAVAGRRGQGAPNFSAACLPAPPAGGAPAAAVARRWFQASAAQLKKRNGKSDDGDDAERPSSGDNGRSDPDAKEDGASPAEGADKNSGRRRTARRSEGERATSGGGGGGEEGGAQPDPLTQLKRAVGVADYGQGQQSFIPDSYPNVMMLPITRRPLFPSLYKSIQVQDPQVIGALKELVERGEPYVATFMLRNDDKDVDSIKSTDEVHDIGVFSRIMSIYVSPNPEDKHLTVALYPWRRVRMKRILGAGGDGAKEGSSAPAKEASASAGPGDVPAAGEAAKPEDQAPPPTDAGDDAGKAKQVLESIEADYSFTALEVENVEDEPYDIKDATISATMSEIVSVLREITTMNPMFREQIHHFASAQVSKAVFENPSKLADFAAALSGGSSEELQDILSDLNVATRLEKALVVLKKELMNAQLQNKISKDVEAKISKRQRDFYLMEQLKGIKRELGLESDGKDKLIEQFKAKAETLQMPAEVKKVFDEEVGKLAHLEPAASEFNVTRNYLDWLTQIPWGKQSAEDYDLVRAKTVLDKDHYGLDDVKQRILEFIAVGKL